MKAKFTRADDNRLGIRFEPETFEEQLLLEMFARSTTSSWSSSDHEFRFSGWEYNNQGRELREGLTSVWGQLVKRDKTDPPQAEAKPVVEAAAAPFRVASFRAELERVRREIGVRLAPDHMAGRPEVPLLLNQIGTIDMLLRACDAAELADRLDEHVAKE